MTERELTRRKFLQNASAAGAAVVLARDAIGQNAPPATAPAFHGDFRNTPDRIWLGSEYWANPMEDWKIAGGRIECTSEGGNRNVHLLTRSLAPGRGHFDISVRCGMIQHGERGGMGLRIGIHDEINDYRGNCIFGEGVDAGLANGMLILGKKTEKLDGEPELKDITISLRGENKASLYQLTLTITDNATSKNAQSNATVH